MYGRRSTERPTGCQRVRNAQQGANVTSDIETDTINPGLSVSGLRGGGLSRGSSRMTRWRDSFEPRGCDRAGCGCSIGRWDR
jgi:hypothetical protein